MITPFQITINTDNLPAIVQTAILAIDAAITTWAIGETEKYWQITWANNGGWSQAKENGLKTLLEAYDMLGWHTRILIANQITFKVAFQRP